jgi:hypothetical protein
MFKFFLKLLCVTRTRIRILESGSVKNIHQTRNAKGFRIRTRSGSANHTKLKANASGSGFLNPDSGLFMRTHNVSMPTQVSLFHQNCLYSDTGVSFPPKVSLRWLRRLFSTKSVSTLTQVSLFLQSCLKSNIGVSFPPKIVSTMTQVSVFIKKCL